MKSFAVTLILAVSGLLLLAGVVEKWRHRRNLAAIPIRVLVNGTRGKTSVTRLIAAALREAQVRTWAKTTGTQAAWILPDGSEQEYRKNRPVNIREQIPFIRAARRDGAQAVVIECMALHPENQKMMGWEFVRPTVQVMTNARVDHVCEIGATEGETVATLAQSIFPQAQVVADDARFDAYTPNRISSLEERVEEGYVESFDYPMFQDNVRQALAVARLLGVDRQTALGGMRKARPDVGMCGPFRVGCCTVINAFAANDLDSSRALLHKALDQYGLAGQPLWVLFNNRSDREFRLGEFLPLVGELAAQGAQVRVIGENRGKAARYFARKAGARAEPLAQPPLDWIDSLKDRRCAVLCLGNIKGAARETIEALQARKAEWCPQPGAATEPGGGAGQAQADQGERAGHTQG